MPTYYVSTTGSNVTGDGSSGNPWQTIAFAITSAISGDTIKIFSGTYNETLSITKSLTIESENGVKTSVTIASTGTTITVQPSVNNVTIRNLTITSTSSSLHAIGLNITRDFSVNPSGLPVMATLIQNFMMDNCNINYNRYAVVMNAKNSTVQNCTLVQSGVVSSHTTFLLYTIDNVTISGNTHVTMTSGLSRFIYGTIAGGGDYKKNLLSVTGNTVNVTNDTSSGHFILIETAAMDPADLTTKFRINVQNNTVTTNPTDQGGFVIVFPNGPTNFQNMFDSVTWSVIANNVVTNPYRAWLYFDISVSEPIPMGSTYFRIYGNTFTVPTATYRPLSWDVDTPTLNNNVFLSTTPVSIVGWPAVYTTDSGITPPSSGWDWSWTTLYSAAGLVALALIIWYIAAGGIKPAKKISKKTTSS